VFLLSVSVELEISGDLVDAVTGSERSRAIGSILREEGRRGCASTSLNFFFLLSELELTTSNRQCAQRGRKTCVFPTQSNRGLHVRVRREKQAAMQRQYQLVQEGNEDFVGGGELGLIEVVKW
jgi:hypothetical protein